MEIDMKNEAGVLIFTLRGDLMGGPEAESFHKAVESAIEKEQVQAIADLSQVHWMNSSGLGMLIRGMISLRSSGGDLRLTGISERVRRTMEIARLDTVFHHFNSVTEAINSYK
ncbi:MAG TPA: STAS domain-containing protein [bacterium]|nr:STAS domain-containing protein [bacterium]HQG44984.1 STAS domain-containing protein [bacterium]HQI47126.1 STAS domain-containing protein [bacterium]HQJ63156.1 STAS domain-containing protein [bacterium]